MSHFCYSFKHQFHGFNYGGQVSKENGFSDYGIWGVRNKGIFMPPLLTSSEILASCSKSPSIPKSIINEIPPV